jgi:PTS system mannose-specific IIC component
VASVGATSSSFPDVGAFAVAVLVGLATGWIGGWTMVKQRQIIAGFARPRLDQLAAGSRKTVIGLQVFGMTLDLARGTVLGALMILVARPLAVLVNARWSVGEDLSRAIIITAVVGVAAAAVWKDFHAISGTRRLFVAALAVGTLLVVVGA